MATVTDFGKMLRILRIEHDVMLKTMAENIGISAPYLSAIETGKKPITAQLLNKIIDYLNLPAQQANELVAIASKLDQDIIIKPANDCEAELALMFARKMDNKTLDFQKILNLLKEE